MKKDVMLVTGAGQISMAIARRTGYGKKLILGDKNLKNAEAIAEIMNHAGFDAVPFIALSIATFSSLLRAISESPFFTRFVYE